MNKNLIQGRYDEASWPNTAKPCGLVVQVNEAVVRGRTAFLPGEVSSVRADEKSAEPRDEVASHRLPRRGERREAARSNS
jgi:hypothetical protein